METSLLLTPQYQIAISPLTPGYLISSFYTSERSDSWILSPFYLTTDEPALTTDDNKLILKNHLGKSFWVMGLASKSVLSKVTVVEDNNPDRNSLCADSLSAILNIPQPHALFLVERLFSLPVLQRDVVEFLRWNDPINYISSVLNVTDAGELQTLNIY